MSFWFVGFFLNFVFFWRLRFFEGVLHLKKQYFVSRLGIEGKSKFFIL